METFEKGKKALRKHIIENKEKVINDLEELRKKSNSNKIMKQKPNRIILRLLNSPIIIVLNIVTLSYNIVRNTYLFIRYGGEWITYEKGTKKSINDVFEQINTDGCLKDKTPEMINGYFSGLIDFIDSDRLFFLEQYSDLKKNEREKFNSWFADSKYRIADKAKHVHCVTCAKYKTCPNAIHSIKKEIFCDEYVPNDKMVK